MASGHWPENVGILAMEVYFPLNYVCQERLEEFDGVGKGKYTIGLGQKKMAFCDDQEDINSLCLTAVKGLLERNKIDPKDVGRLDVGTETIVDKSKSIKSVLMQLFEKSGNHNIEGIDTTNACYGGTAALFNALNWIESSSWDGRYAIVVMGDIAVYAEGNARCTGGAGSIAFLVGKDAPLVIDRGIRGTHMQHCYDFYKPEMASEYPVVDGKLSVKCYFTALDKCYEIYKDSYGRKYKSKHQKPSIADFDYMLFHTPFCKIVQKSFGRMMVHDLLALGDETDDTAEQKYKDLLNFRGICLEDVFDNEKFYKEMERSSVKCSEKLFEKMTKPSLLLAENIGNMYTPSLYGGLASLLVNVEQESLINKRVVLFSYGSGLASSMFSLKICPEEKLRQKFSKMVYQMQSVKMKLNQRIEVEPDEFAKILKRREETHHLPDYTPVSSQEKLWPGTYYLTNVDKKFRRTYARKAKTSKLAESVETSCGFL